MTDVHEHALSRHLAQLRADFDRSFAAAPAQAPDEVPFLLLQVGADRVAVRLQDVSGLVACGRIVPVPSRAPTLLGIAGIRGAIVPIFSLARVLGQQREAARPRWVLLCGTEPLGLGFAEIEGQVGVAPAGLREVRAEGRSPHVSHVVAVANGIRPLLSIASILQALTTPAAERAPLEETTA